MLSAHRTPEEAGGLRARRRRRGVKAFICGAGRRAHLAGAVAAHTTRPVIGVPIAAGTLSGFDSLLVDGADAAGHAGGDGGRRRRGERGLLAAQIVALSDAALARSSQRRKHDARQGARRRRARCGGQR